LILTGAAALNGTGNALNNALTGNSANNVLIGNEGNDTLNGGAGADTLLGGLGNDTYTVDNLKDVIVEEANAGIDTVRSSVSWTLGSNLEKLILMGTAAINGTGNALGNALTGNSGNNLLTGYAGDDSLSGGSGNDTLLGGDGNDILTGGVGGDVLTGGLGNDTLNLTKDTNQDVIFYAKGDGQDTVQNFVRGVGGDLLSFSGITAIDVVKSGKNTQFRLSDGIASNPGFGKGELLMTLQGTTGFTSANIADDLATTNAAQFWFS
jgi:Ca2+-binding RTX toxin-like protein